MSSRAKKKSEHRIIAAVDKATHGELIKMISKMNMTDYAYVTQVCRKQCRPDLVNKITQCTMTQSNIGGSK
jgi:hypothetical protein